ncbi:hypothetical protein IFM89_032768 [Coptis chinensis]|uniref:O-methyltransferase C-terminal domain-containing protein n=1 Tax=Coptis chinensis TaxID=261450 RepID=A0A835LPJ9_9MAGN|nr:hypothetical protein IFM89_032768 [Coptis chinensis]
MCGKDLELNVVMCSSLIIGICKLGNIWYAVKIMEDMETTRLRPDSTLLCDSSINFQQDSSLATSNQGKNVSRQSLAAVTVELTVSFPLVRRASANVAHGMPLFQYSSVNPRFNEVFSSTMFHATSLMMNEIFIGKYKGFENMKEVTDIGGGIGNGS